MFYFISLPVSSDYFISILNKMNTFLIPCNIFGERENWSKEFSGGAPAPDGMVRLFLPGGPSGIVCMNLLPSRTLSNTSIFLIIVLFLFFVFWSSCLHAASSLSAPNLLLTFPGQWEQKGAQVTALVSEAHKVSQFSFFICERESP